MTNPTHLDRKKPKLYHNGLTYLDSLINRYRLGDKNVAFDGQIFYKKKRTRG